MDAPRGRAGPRMAEALWAAAGMADTSVHSPTLAGLVIADHGRRLRVLLRDGSVLEVSGPGGLLMEWRPDDIAAERDPDGE